MIQEISFKNFRRFENFPPMKLNDINIFVGRNNSGKSTVLKALQLMNGNISAIDTTKLTFSLPDGRPGFVFDIESQGGVNIDTFERALYRKAKRKEITLTAQYDTASVKIVLDGESVSTDEHITVVPYTSIEIKSDTLELRYNFKTRDFELTSTSIPSECEIEDNKYELKNLEDKLSDTLFEISDYETDYNNLEEEISGADEIDPSILGDKLVKMGNIKKKIAQLRKEEKNIEESIKDFKYAETSTSHITIENMESVTELCSVSPFLRIFLDLSRYMESKTEGRPNSKKYKAEETKKATIKELFPTIQNLINNLGDEVSTINVHFIHAHAASQKVIYLKDDKSDTLSKTLSDFCKAKITKGQTPWNFVKKWMGKKGLQIGDDFKVTQVEGAGYLLKIIEDGEEYNLADKGTGSIQLMTMLLTLALIINKPSENTLILIEEPEQNIHPQLQSLLADLFLDFRNEINDKKALFRGGFHAQLIVETHSEYLVRRTQVLVAEANFKDEKDIAENNPFRTYYFDKDCKDTPVYEMEYENTGGFKQRFGAGFYDEASKLDLQIMQKEKEVRNSMTAEDLISLINK